MDANKSQNPAENKSFNEFNISSFSSATGMDPKDEKIRKLEAKLQQIEETNSNQFGGPSMMQMGWQMDEKFGKMEKKMKKIEAKNAKLEGQIAEKNEEMGKMKAEIQVLAKENVDLKEKVEKLAKENGEINEEIGKMKKEFGKMIGFEGKMRKSLEQKADKETLDNLIGRIDGIDLIQLNKNKWNAADSGPELAISDEGRFVAVKHSGTGYNCIRAILPIQLFNLNVYNYFEVEVVSKAPRWIGGIQIGFCTQQFPLQGSWLGNEENSIGIYSRFGMRLDGQDKKFGNGFEYFHIGDVLGLGILHLPANSPIKCFATLNGRLLGTIDLPDYFAFLQIYPAATLANEGDSIRANFGQQKWRFNPSQLLE